jgi:anti-sigma-K factor RskA
MKGLEIAPNALGIVHWNQDQKLAYIEVKYLPPPPAGKQYQLWAIVKGKPTDMGVLTLEPGENILKTVPFIANAQAFAVTLEDIGGSPVPTLDQMYLLGNVG